MTTIPPQRQAVKTMVEKMSEKPPQNTGRKNTGFPKTSPEKTGQATAPNAASTRTEPRRKPRLGRGIMNLLGAEGPDIAELSRLEPREETVGRRQSLPVAYLEADNSQPRRHFDAEKLEELTQSIRQKGILQPLIVRQMEPTRFVIIAGERRWRAAQQAGLHDVPVVIEKYSDTDALEVALIENIQREELTAYEEALAYDRLLARYTQKQIATKVGKSRSHIANLLRLLALPRSVLEALQAGQISMGHARALVGHPHADALARRIIQEGLNVRQTESLVAAVKKDSGASLEGGKGASPAAKDADTLAIEKQIAAILEMSVSLRHQGDGGRLILGYSSLEQLDDFLARIGADPRD